MYCYHRVNHSIPDAHPNNHAITWPNYVITGLEVASPLEPIRNNFACHHPCTDIDYQQRQHDVLLLS